MPTHWGISGEVDGWSGKGFAALMDCSTQMKITHPLIFFQFKNTSVYHHHKIKEEKNLYFELFQECIVPLINL